MSGADEPRVAAEQVLPAERLPAERDFARPSVSSTRPAIVAPLSPERYKVQFTITRETHDKLRRVQDLMRHSVPNGDPAVIFDRALSELLDRLEKRRLAQTRKPKPKPKAKPEPGHATSHKSRHVPSAVTREVWARDGSRCTFVGADGRCSARGFLELHHVVPYADGGATDAANLTLRCRAHNQHDADARFGRWTVREGPMPYELGSNRAGSQARSFAQLGVNRDRAP